MSDYKVGQIVRVVRNDSGHFLLLDSLARVKSWYSKLDGVLLLQGASARHPNGNVTQIVNVSDIEPEEVF